MCAYHLRVRAWLIEMVERCTRAGIEFRALEGDALDLELIAGASYDLSCQLVYQAASTGGLEMALGGTATASFALESIRSGTSAAAQINQAHNAATIGNTTPTLSGGAVTTATTDFPSEFKAGLEASGAGTLVVEFQSAAAVQTKVRRGSFCVLHQN